MTDSASVVTPERFNSGHTYKDYLEQVVNVNKDWFTQLYDDFQIDPEDAGFFKEVSARPDGPAKMMVIGEDWCPDVYRGMPTVARIAEAGGMDMRIFPRDSHKDIMAEFLKEGLYESIPTVVFYTSGHDYICHWIERPELADREMAETTRQIKAEMPDATDVQQRAAARPRNQERFPVWQRESVKEIRELLAQKLGLT